MSSILSRLTATSLTSSIADLLHVHLGIPADLTNTKDSTKDRTHAEMFHSYRETHSQAWRAHRDEVGQGFLDVFVRQNQPEIDEIPFEEHVVRIKLPAAEWALYKELEHHLNILDAGGNNMASFAFRGVKKNAAPSVQDRLRRLKKVTDNSRDSRECLIKRSCGFDPPSETIENEEDEDGNPIPVTKPTGKANSKAKTRPVTGPNGKPLTPGEVCDLISRERQEQLGECLADLRFSLKWAIELFNEIPWASEAEKRETKFIDWAIGAQRSGEGDPDVLVTMRDMFAEFKCTPSGKIGPNPKLTPDEAKLRALENKENKSDDHAAHLRTVTKGKTQNSAKKIKDAAYDLSEKTHILRKLSQELRARKRSARYFNAIRHVQKHGPNPNFVCPVCGEANRAETVTSACGHTACWECMHGQARFEETCPIDKCDQLLAVQQLVRVATLDREGHSGEFGAKMMEVLRIVEEVATPKGDSVIVFAQFGLELVIQEALQKAGVPVTVIDGSARQMSMKVNNFQKNHSGKTSVLVLNTAAVSAAGANLTQANHTIFFHPIHAPTLHQYRSIDTQSVGRTRRYGQNKTVHVWRLLAISTIDDVIFRERTGAQLTDDDPAGEMDLATLKGYKKQTTQAKKVAALVEGEPAVAVIVEEPIPKIVELEDSPEESAPAPLDGDEPDPVDLELDVNMDDADAQELIEFADVDADGDVDIIDIAAEDEDEPSAEEDLPSVEEEVSTAGLPSRDEAPIVLDQEVDEPMEVEQQDERVAEKSSEEKAQPEEKGEYADLLEGIDMADFEADMEEAELAPSAGVVVEDEVL